MTAMPPLNAAALRAHIRSTLQLFDPRMVAPEAENLLLGTCAQESRLGTDRRQVGGGPALGIYQIEPATEQSLWHDYLSYRKPLAIAVAKVCGVDSPDRWHLENNLAYQHIMVRLRYWAWVKAPIPLTIEGQAVYWDVHYNANPHHGTPAEYIENYRRFVG